VNPYDKARLQAARLAAPLAAALDRAITHAVASRHKSGSERMDDRRLLERAERAASYFDRLAVDEFFQPPRSISPLSSASGRGYVTLSWASNHTPTCGEVADEYSSHTPNATNVVRLFRGKPERPVAVLVHGYMGGSFALEQRVWPMQWLDALGFDVALFTLPFHGLRAVPQGKAPAFPQSNIQFNAEGFRQSVTDLRELVHWLKQNGHPKVGLMGMSLGGYVAALTATLQSELAFLVPIIPLACLAEFAREQGRVPRGTQSALLYQDALRRAYRLVSPLSRPPCIAPERVLVVAGKADRITPPHHARALARHFSAPLEAWPGGHLLQFGRAKSLQRVGSFLRDACAR
jgi:alpha-beta hydrolase superfamily lysophospholipase